MLDNVLLVLGLDVLVIHRLTRFGVNPSDIGLTVTEFTIKVLDETHHPSHLDTTLNGEFATGLHFPSGPRRTPRTDFSKTGTDNDLVEIDQALKVLEFIENVVTVNLGEVKGEVGSGSDGNLLVKPLGVTAVDDTEVGRVVKGDGFSQLGHSVDVDSDRCHNLSQTGDTVHTTVEVGPDGFDLGNVEQEGVHETENVKGHLLGGESPDTKLFETLGNKVGSAHETGTSSPADDGTSDTEILSPTFGGPPVEQGFKRNLGLRVETVVTKDTVVGRKREDDLGGSGYELTSGLFLLDGTKETEKVGKHESVGELRFVVNRVDFTTVLGKSGEGNNVVQVDLEGGVNVIDKRLNILTRSTVEGNDNKLGALGTKLVENALVVVDSSSRVSRGGHDTGTTTREKTLEDLNTDGTLADTGEKSGLLGESDTRSGNFSKDIKVFLNN